MPTKSCYKTLLAFDKKSIVLQFQLKKAKQYVEQEIGSCSLWRKCST